MSVSPRTLVDKIWDAHVVEDMGDGWALLHIDRHLLHDLSGPGSLADIKRRGLRVGQPMQVLAIADHLVSTEPDRTPESSPVGAPMWAVLKDEADTAGVDVAGAEDPGQGIVHVAGPEQGFVLPGLTVICGDSHTCTNGALGALAFGVGSSQSAQALATRILLQERPRQMRVTVTGAFGTRDERQGPGTASHQRPRCIGRCRLCDRIRRPGHHGDGDRAAAHSVQPDGRARRQVWADRPR